MVYISNEKAIRVIASSAEIEVEDLVKVKLKEGELIAVYDVNSGREDVNVPCRWYVYIYNTSTVLKIYFDDVEIRFNL